MAAAVAAPGFQGWASRLLGRRAARWEAMSDGALLGQAKRGDERACRELLARHGPRLWAAVEATHRDPGLAEDVVQETLLRAIDRADQLMDEHRAFPWLVRIALRVAIDHKRKVRREALLEEGWDAAGPPEDAPDQHLASAEDARRVSAAVAQLDDYPRELVSLRYFAHLSAAELGEVFGKTDVAIRKDLQRARAQLRVALAPWMEDAP
ncbi:MAG: sigma-70 family RNA polymerase sigma factor [Myxococcales bacterium]|nr:sigma-70 family RNA polymerase sigma factor [Myxococcales bacterium]